MSIAKEIGGRIFGVWALLLFVATMLLVVPIVWVIGIAEEPKRTNILIKIFKAWMKLFLFVTGCQLKLRGKENFKKGENYIVICNHNSFMDIVVITPMMPGGSKTIAKAEMAKIPLFGMMYKRGSVLVDRKDKDSRSESYKKMRAVLNMGLHMCIYPEGTRNKTSQPLKEFHNGAFKLAVETQKPIMPAIIFNTKKVMPADKKFFFFPAKMEVHFLPPVYVSSTDNYEELKDKLFTMMSEYYSAHSA